MDVRLNLKLRDFCVFQFAIVTMIIALGCLGYTIGKISGNDHMPYPLRLLDVGAERSIPTYFSAINLLLAAILFYYLLF